MLLPATHRHPPSYLRELVQPAEWHPSWDRRAPPEHPRDWDHHRGPLEYPDTRIHTILSVRQCPEPNGDVALFCESICVSHTILLGVEVGLAVLPIPVHRPLEHFHRRRALAGYHAHVDACVRSVEELEGVSRFWWRPRQNRRRVSSSH